jgi:hypothetical protein
MSPVSVKSLRLWVNIGASKLPERSRSQTYKMPSAKA